VRAPRSEEFVPFVARRLERAPHVEASPPPEVFVDDTAEQSGDDRVAQSTASFAPAGDPSECEAAIRERAIRMAGIACARALHEAIARNPLFVARFVDDALAAFGDAKRARVRLSPADAVVCAGTVRCDVVADDALAPGEVVVESDVGSLRASIEARAERLARAAADE
jgi:flagellar biosynthesis/type III secretory pathway protein FliH